jgi:hypothetical protein
MVCTFLPEIIMVFTSKEGVILFKPIGALFA